MKLVLKVSLALVLAVSTLTYAPKSHAVVGFFINHKTTKIVGGSAAAVGLGGSAAIMFVGGLEGLALAAILGPIALGALGIGIIVLDGSEHATLRYSTLTAASTRELGLTSGQARAFNENVDIFNVILQELEWTLPDNVTLEESAAAWSYYLSVLNVSEEAQFVLGVVSQNLIHQIQAPR